MKEVNLIDRLLLAIVLLFVVLFIGTVGYMLFAQEMTPFQSLYMTVITVSTIGYGEEVDLSNNVPARIFTIFLAISGIGVIAYFTSSLAAVLIEGDLTHHFRRRRMMRKLKKMEDHYIICGIGRVGLNIARELKDTQRPYVFADNDEQKVEHALSVLGGNAVGLVGDCSEDDLLQRMRVKQARGIFVATDNDNTNLVICVTARQFNPDIRIVAMSKQAKHIKKFNSVGAHKVISPSFIGGMRMASEMIRPDVTTFLDKMLRNKELNLRVDEVAVSEKCAGKKLADLNIDQLPTTILVGVQHGEDYTLKPKDGYILQQGDTLMLMTTPEERIKIEAYMQ